MRHKAYHTDLQVRRHLCLW